MADMLFTVGFSLTSNHAGLIYATVLSFRYRFARTSLVIPPTHCLGTNNAQSWTDCPDRLELVIPPPTRDTKTLCWQCSIRGTRAKYYLNEATQISLDYSSLAHGGFFKFGRRHDLRHDRSRRGLPPPNPCHDH